MGPVWLRRIIHPLHIVLYPNLLARLSTKTLRSSVKEINVMGDDHAAYAIGLGHANPASSKAVKVYYSAADQRS